MADNPNTLDKPQVIVVQAPDVTVTNEVHPPPPAPGPIASLTSNVTEITTGVLDAVPNVVSNVLAPASTASVNVSIAALRKNILELHVKLDQVLAALRSCNIVSH